MKKAIAVAFALTAASFAIQAAKGAPPPPNSMDARIMDGYGPAIREMLVPGTRMGCCSESDCRPADYRIKTDDKGTHYQVFIRPQDKDGSGWQDGTSKWEDVPDNVIIAPQDRKNIPFPTACWIKTRMVDNGFLCFSPGSGS